jgi:diguanylate cyclase (GGDEF)-like protein
MAEATRRGEPLALVLIDAHDLGALNRAHSPQAGDQMLKEIASILTEDAGTNDRLVRYGTEEFALLVHGGDPDRIRHLALEIQQRVEARARPGLSGSRQASVSVGAACFPDSLASDGPALRLKAEQALELARQRGPGGLIIL